MRRKGPNPKAALGVTVLVLVGLSLAPTPLTGWMRVVRQPVLWAVGPLSSAGERLSAALRPPRNAVSGGGSRTMEQLEAAIADLTARNLQLTAELREAEILIGQLGRLSVTTGIETRTVPATRIATDLGGGTIEVRPGASAGVTVNAVALAPSGLQVVGIVTRTAPATSTVHLLTDRRFEPGLVVGVVAGPEVTIGSTDQLDRLPRIQLEPTGRGTLVAEAVAVEVASALSVGDTVRVLDETWPRSAQLLELGAVLRILDTDEPLFKRVVVLPRTDPARVRSMLLRMPDEAEVVR